MPHPAPSARPDSVIEAPRREHSRKPDEAYALIEGMYPELPKIELFARQPRPGDAARHRRTLGSRQRAMVIKPVLKPPPEKHSSKNKPVHPDLIFR